MKRVVAEISRSAILSNLASIRKSSFGARVCAVVKADAYGHGGVTVAAVCERAGVDFFAVATKEEGIALRNGGIRSPILILGYTPVSDAPLVAKYELTVTLFSKEHSSALAARCAQLGIKINAHIKVDTGMHRLGFAFDDLDTILDVCKHPCYNIDGIFSHFSSSDEAEESNFTASQKQRLIFVSEWLEARGINIPIKHIANSAAIFDGKYSLDMVRAGIALYGYGNDSLIPAMTVKSHIVSLRRVSRGERVGYSSKYAVAGDSIIATVPAGYADGFRRDLCEKGVSLLVRGREARVFGRVCMDYMMLDVTEIDGVSVGDEVIFFGNVKGHTAIDVATKLDTVPHEIMTSLSSRVERILVD